MKRKRLGILPSLIIGTLVLIAYKIFRTPELDKELEKFAQKESNL